MTSEFSVKVNKVPAGTVPDELRAVFEAAGFNSITDVYLPEKFAKFEFGFVRFGCQEEAQRAAVLSGAQLRGVILECELAVNDKKQGRVAASTPPVRAAATWKGGNPSQNSITGSQFTSLESLRPPQTEGGLKSSASSEYSVWVGGLPLGTTSEQLREAFLSRGIDMMTDVYLPPAKDYGFVRFGSADEATLAMQSCSFLEVGGNPVELKLSTTEKRCAPQLYPACPPAEMGTGVGLLNVGAGPRLVAGQSALQQTVLARQRQGADGSVVSTSTHSPSTGGKGWNGARSGRGELDTLSSGGSGSPGPASLRSASEHSIWIGSLAEGVTAEDLREAFRLYGVESMTDIYIPPGRDFGFIRFATYEEAEEAMQHCNNFTVHGASVDLQLSTAEKRQAPAPLRPPAAAPQPSSFASQSAHPVAPGPCPGPGLSTTSRASDHEVSLKVSGLPSGTSAEELREALVARGLTGMSDVYIPRARNFGFIRFYKLSEAQQGLACNGMAVRGTPITIEMAEGEKRSSEFFHSQSPQVLPQVPQVAQVAQVPPAQHSWTGLGTAGGKGSSSGKGLSNYASPSSRSGEVSIKVSNLPPEASPEEMAQAFASQGIDSMTDCYIPFGRRFGFVRFLSQAEGRYALQRQIWMRGHLLELEPALGNKRSSQEMSGGAAYESAHLKRPVLVQDFGEVPQDPNFGPDAPSVKVNGIPLGTTTQELHNALLEAGCGGKPFD